MSSNKKARQALEKKYGKVCFIERLHLRRDSEPSRYTSKGQMKKMQQLSFHHILEKRNGGQATVENGALLTLDNHRWFHRQSESKQAVMNAMFQEYKRQIDECKVVLVDDLKVPYEIKPMEFVLDERKQGKYNRAREKQEVRRMSERYVER